MVEPGYLDSEMGASDTAVHVGCSSLYFTSRKAMKISQQLKIVVMLVVMFIIICFFIFFIADTIHNGNERVRAQESLQSMERVGSIGINNDTVFLWEFTYNGRKCLWATKVQGRGGYGGLTCWEETK